MLAALIKPIAAICRRAHIGPARCLSDTLALSPNPVEVKLRRAAKRLDISYSDGSTFSLPAELLRVLSPSAESTRKDAQGLARVVSGRRHVGILSVEPVGSYALRICFDDLHQAGIYSWAYLYDLGARKVGCRGAAAQG
ncbi:phosphoribosylformimino-5-aminoimidazole carboxamide ribotide isomerase [Haematococcus lacustris]|uniref:Phosphoribosylformimino-5-aminoimidazole carboxamide ribotide isomerase n=1 Tax=Haematococcus lacustris TaxID=44745 RepID=A0A699Z417_HAELA|nr:phosphoribosylformimino-5-aminoimidazole carboxamide ribotide isomerase [Haematococcus lacustris]